MSEVAEILTNSVEDRIESSYKSALETTLAEAREEYNAFLKSFVASTKSDFEYLEANPESVDTLIKNYTERFERLKFLFLEQEAKEIFMRRILDPDLDQNIDLLGSEEKLEVLRRKLNSKKDEIDTLTNDISDKSKHAFSLYGDILFKKETSLNLLDEIKKKNKELLKVYEDIDKFNSQDPSLKEFEEFAEVPNLDFDIKDLNKEQLENKLNEFKAKRELNKLKIKELEDKKSFKISKLAKDSERSYQLNLNKQKLDTFISELNEKKLRYERDLELDKILKDEFKISGLVELLKRISFLLAFNFKADEKIIFFKFQNFEHEDCKIYLNDDEIRIKKIAYPLLEEEALNSIIEKSNNSKNPVFEATNLMYKSLLRY